MEKGAQAEGVLTLQLRSDRHKTVVSDLDLNRLNICPPVCTLTFKWFFVL